MTGQCHACDCRQTGVWITKSIRGSIFTDPTVADVLCHDRRLVCCLRALVPLEPSRAEPPLLLLNPQGDKSKKAKLLLLLLLRH